MEDAPLVAQALAGNDRAFSQLYRRHARYAAGIVYRLMGSDAELEDVIQEGFVDASRALASLPDVAALCEVSLATVKRRIAEAEAVIERRTHEGE